MKSLLEEISYFLWLFTWWGLLADLPLHRFALAFFIRTLKRLDNQAFCPFLIKAVNLYISANVLSPILQHVPQPPIFCFLVCKVVVCIKALMHEDNAYALFFERRGGAVYYGEDEEPYLRGELLDGWVGICLVQGFSPLLSSPRPYHLTLMQCSWCVGNDTLTDFHVTFAPRNSPWCGVSLCISITSNFLHFQLLFDLQTTPHPC